jgi:hypothetical protein
MSRKKSDAEVVKRRLPPIGTRLQAKFKGKIYEAHIVGDPQAPEGKSVKLGEKRFNSLSAAARSFTRFPVNGWRYWKVQK